VVKLSLKLPNPHLGFFEQLPYRARMMMALGGKGDKVLQAVVIPSPVNVMNLPSFWRCAICVFPNKYMFKYLMSGIGAGVSLAGYQNIPRGVFGSAAFPVWVIFALARFSIARMTQGRMPPYGFPTFGAWLFVARFISMIVFPPFRPKLISLRLNMASLAANAITWRSAILAVMFMSLCVNCNLPHIESITFSIGNCNTHSPKRRDNAGDR
jgi:hypothetical protein